MEKYESDINPNIFRKNIKYLEELKYEPLEMDKKESITPKTNKGHLNPEGKKSFFEKVQEGLSKLLKNNEDEEFYKTVQGDFKNQVDLGIFLEQEQKSLEAFTTDKLYIKKYQYNESATSKVLRFGINAFNKELKQYLDLDYNPEISKREVAQISDVASVLSKSIKDKKEEANNKDQVFQEFKIKAQNQITPIEKSIIKQGIDYLNEAKTKTILVDLFARHNKDGKYASSYVDRDKEYKAGHVKYTKDGDIETHTVVLYKQGVEYLVIDPSNAEFSAILVGTHNNIRVCFSKKFQVYQPVEKAEELGLLGLNLNQWRDCVDIAVKLAFNLNRNNQRIELEKFNKSEIIKTDSLKSNISIEEISNNPEMYKILPGELDYYPIRSKQSSNIVEGKLYNATLKYLFNTYKVLENKISEMNFFYSSEKFQTIRENYFTKEYAPEKYGDAIGNLMSIFYEIKNTTDIGEIKLLAEEMKSIESIFYEA